MGATKYKTAPMPKRRGPRGRKRKYGYSATVAKRGRGVYSRGRKRKAKTGYKKYKMRRKPKALLMSIRKQPYIQDQVTFGGNHAVRRHKYVSTFEVAALLTGTEFTSNWAANGIFKPDIGGIGHQPYGHDEMAVFFDHYRVLRSKIRIREVVVATDSAPSPQIYVYKKLFQNAGPVKPTFIGRTDAVLLEEGLINLPVKNGGAFAGSKGQKVDGFVLSSNFNTKSLARYSRDHNKQDYTIAVGTNPNGTTEPSVQFHIRISNKIDSLLILATSRKITMLVELEYEVLWSGKKVQGQS